MEEPWSGRRGAHDTARRSAPRGVRWGMLLLGLGILSICTVVPTGPSVLVLPAVGKSMNVFQVEESACQSYARQQLVGAPEQAASRRLLQVQYDRAYVQYTDTKGNMVPGVVAPGASVAPSPLGTLFPGLP